MGSGREDKKKITSPGFGENLILRAIIIAPLRDYKSNLDIPNSHGVAAGSRIA